MEIVSNSHERITEIWLANSEVGNPDVQMRIDNICKGNKRRKFTTAIFYSGKEDLGGCTEHLILKNI